MALAPVDDPLMLPHMWMPPSVPTPEPLQGSDLKEHQLLYLQKLHTQLVSPAERNMRLRKLLKPSESAWDERLQHLLCRLLKRLEWQYWQQGEAPTEFSWTEMTLPLMHIA